MSYCRLNINGVDVGFDNSLPVSINKSVANIREPEKRNSGYSKTITVPGTPEANKLFEFIFEVNVESNQYNPNRKVPASYYVNEVRVFKGDLQLLNITKNYNGLQQQVEYECSILAENGNLFLDISGLFLTDLDLSDLDHEFTYASGLFNPTLGEGYCYPYIDYGVNPHGVRVGRTWTFEHLKPAVFEREYVRRIFEDAGYTWASGFLDSDYYKHIIIPDVNPGALQLPVEDISNNQFYAVFAGSSQDLNNQAGSHIGSGAWNFASLSEVSIFDDDSVDGFDPGGLYNTGTGIFTPAINATHTISTNINFQLTVTPPATTTSIAGVGVLKVHIQKSTDGGTVWTTETSVSTTVSFLDSAMNPYPTPVQLPPTLVNLPAKFRVLVELIQTTIIFMNGGSPVTGGSASIAVNYSGSFGAILTTANLPSGSTVEMNRTIPPNVTQLDFLTSIIKAENLYIEPSLDVNNQYIIEPREDFILDTDPLDWTEKLDLDRPITITPMGELDVKRYVFTYKSDKDFYNKLYEDEFKEPYGTETIEVDTDFVKGEKKIELVFSPTPSASAADVNSADMVVPRFFSMDAEGTVAPLQCNIRRLYWGGMIDCSSHYLIPDGYADTSAADTYTGSSPIFPVTQYPYAGHVDNPIDPTIDLNFDNPYRIYWLFPNMSFTNNDRYGARYSKFISEITDRDSKIVTAYFRLTEKDIYEFSFRRKVFVDGTYYFVNEIKDYDPQEEKSIPVELLKLQIGPTFTPMSITLQEDVIGGGGMGSARSTFNARGNYGSGKSFGTNNINNDPNALVIGNNNHVG